MKKSQVISYLVILGIILLSSYIILTKNKPQNTDDKITKCIGQNSELYIQLGCHACKTQEELFGENYKSLKVIDCFYESDKCISKNITATPSWIIDEKKIIGVQTIQELKTLTGC